MVDCWSEHVVESHLERGGLIAEKHILPVLQSFRKAGMTVVHAPAPGTAAKYPDFMMYDDEMPPRWGFESTNTVDSAWPPASFVQRSGECASFARVAEPLHESWSANGGDERRRIIPCLAPVAGDIVVANGCQLNHLLTERKLLHLFYVGFATNICVEHRDYGMREMSARGYNVILLRDGTTGIELTAGLPHPVRPRLSMTQAAILNLELKVGHSSTCGELVAALAAVAPIVVSGGEPLARL